MAIPSLLLLNSLKVPNPLNRMSRITSKVQLSPNTSNAMFSGHLERRFRAFPVWLLLFRTDVLTRARGNVIALTGHANDPCQ